MPNNYFYIQCPDILMPLLPSQKTTFGVVLCAVMEELSIVTFGKRYYNLSMKFDSQRSKQPIPDRFDLNNQQFLTFRNNPVTEDTGRTVYSQQFDYKSLDRFQKQQDKAEPNFNFRKNLKNLRSQDKYKQLKEEAKLFQAKEENSESQISSIERKEELNNKLTKLKRSLKREKKKDEYLKEQISLLEMEADELEDLNAKQRNSIDELKLILKDNEKNIVLMTRKLEQNVIRGTELKEALDGIRACLENDIKSNRSNEYTSALEYQKQLLEGIEQYQQYKQSIEEKTEFLLEEIDNLQVKLLSLKTLDSDLRNMFSK